MSKVGRIGPKVALVVIVLVLVDVMLFSRVVRRTQDRMATLHYSGRVAQLEATADWARCASDPSSFTHGDESSGLVVPLREDGAPQDASVSLPDLSDFVSRARPGELIPVPIEGRVWSAVVALDRQGPCSLFYLSAPVSATGDPMLRLVISRVLFAGMITASLMLGVVVPLRRRITRLNEQTARLARNGFKGTVDESNDEIGGIGAVVNEAARTATDMLEAEHAQRVLVHNLFADLSHDIRTPLASMKLSVAALAAGDAPEPISGALAGELEYLSSLFSNLSTVAALQSAVVPIEFGEIDPVDVVSRVGQRFQTLARSQGVTLEAAFPASSILVLADATTLEQAISNVVHNALKFANSHVAIVVSSSEAMAEIRVLDDGPGMDPELQARAFERSYRLDNGGTAGTGLGLAIASQILARHRGRVSFGTPAAGGTVVQLFIPLTISALASRDIGGSDSTPR